MLKPEERKAFNEASWGEFRLLMRRKIPAINAESIG